MNRDQDRERARIGPKPGERLMPQLKPADLKNWEPDPAMIDRALGAPEGKDAETRSARPRRPG